MKVLGVDPGPEKSGWCLWDGWVVLECGHHDNCALLGHLRHLEYDLLAIEYPQLRGQQVWNQVLECCWWAGRFAEAMPRVLSRRFQRFTREEVRHHVAGTRRATDAHVNQCLVARFGQKGTKKAPGPLYGVSGHAWDALAVSVVALDKAKESVPSRHLLGTKGEGW